jgi:monoamine oxidase
MAEPDPKPHVCIVGAGISGLRCADILLSSGFQVTILEARDRIGGRVFSIFFSPPPLTSPQKMPTNFPRYANPTLSATQQTSAPTGSTPGPTQTSLIPYISSPKTPAPLCTTGITSSSSSTRKATPFPQNKQSVSQLNSGKSSTRRSNSARKPATKAAGKQSQAAIPSKTSSAGALTSSSPMSPSESSSSK